MYGDDSPTSAVVCTVCRFTYRCAGMWEKCSTNKLAFGHPFSPTLSNFSQRFQGTNVVHYSQQMKAGAVVYECAQFCSDGDVGAIPLILYNLMKADGITALSPRYPHELFLGTNAQGKSFRVWLLTDQGRHLLDLTISNENPEQEKKHPNVP